jgi:very-short-patch-repair endonuclease
MQHQTHEPSRHNAVALRRLPTDAERVLWRKLRVEQLGVKFRRQHPFRHYVLDFVCLERKLVIEVDGGQHNGSVSDETRDRELREAGFTVLRFWNHDVLHCTEDVLQAVYIALNPSPPQPSP